MGVEMQVDPRSGLPQFLKPLTRPLLEQIYLGGNNIKELQYYISEPLTLEFSRITQNLQVINGESKLREISFQDRVDIGRNIPGILVTVNYDNEGRMVLRVSFDEKGDNYVLIFREGRADRNFRLYYQETNNTRQVHYGEEMYDLLMGDDVPLLQIQYNEEVENRHTARVVQGRPLRPPETAPQAEPNGAYEPNGYEPNGAYEDAPPSFDGEPPLEESSAR
jgi:hypothetical protein